MQVASRPKFKIHGWKSRKLVFTGGLFGGNDLGKYLRNCDSGSVASLLGYGKYASI